MGCVLFSKREERWILSAKVIIHSQCVHSVECQLKNLCVDSVS